jgi:hypothetical protein
MRSLADALTKLRELGNLSDRENVEIKTTGIRLPDGRLSGIVSVLGPHDLVEEVAISQLIIRSSSRRTTMYCGSLDFERLRNQRSKEKRHG